MVERRDSNEGRRNGETCSLSRDARKRLLPLRLREKIQGARELHARRRGWKKTLLLLLPLRRYLASTFVRLPRAGGGEEGGNETAHVPARGAVKHARNHVFSTTFRAMKVAQLPGARDTSSSRPLERKIERTGFLFLRLRFFFLFFWSPAINFNARELLSSFEHEFVLFRAFLSDNSGRISGFGEYEGIFLKIFCTKILYSSVEFF